MKAYLSYRQQIAGFDDVRETVKIVEQVSASRIHVLKNRVTAMQSYTEEIERILARFTACYGRPDNPYFYARGTDRAVIILGGDSGLVGGLWHALVSKYLTARTAYERVYVVGNKCRQYLTEEQVPLTMAFDLPQDVPKKSDLEPITSVLFSGFLDGTIGSVDVIYPKFETIVVQTPTVLRLLPFTFAQQQSNAAPAGLPIAEPSPKMFFTKTMALYVALFFYRLVSEAKLAEYSARTIETEHATEKTKDIIRALRLSYFKERRALFTAKQLESFVVHQHL